MCVCVKSVCVEFILFVFLLVLCCMSFVERMITEDHEEFSDSCPRLGVGRQHFAPFARSSKCVLRLVRARVRTLVTYTTQAFYCAVFFTHRRTDAVATVPFGSAFLGELKRADCVRLRFALACVCSRDVFGTVL